MRVVFNNLLMKRLLLVAVAILFFIASALATAQIPDRLIYNGKKYMLHTNPLEVYFEANPERRPEGESFSTALWRGYIADFEVENEVLYVNNVYVESYDGTDRVLKSVKAEVFPNQEKVKADWFTSLLVVPYGKMKNYVHMGYGSTYSKYYMFEVSNGDITQLKQMNHRQYESFKDAQFRAFKTTDEYKKIVGEILSEDPNTTEEFIDSFLRSFVVDYTSKILTE